MRDPGYCNLPIRGVYDSAASFVSEIGLTLQGEKKICSWIVKKNAKDTEGE